MSKLNLIKVELQQMVESISPIVGVEVAIYDINYKVIAATISNEHVEPGMSVSGGHMMNHVINTGEAIINTNPGHNEICIGCAVKENCPECADLSCPIEYQDQIIGIISFTAFDEEQRQVLIDTQKELTVFVTKISKLTGSMVAEKELLRQKKFTLQRLETIISSINDGIIAIDENKKVINYNQLAIKKLGISKRKKEKSFSDVIDKLELDSVLKTGEPIINKEFLYNISNKKINIMVSAWPIFELEKVTGVVVVIRDMAEIHSLVNQLTSESINYTMEDSITQDSGMLRLKERATMVAKTNSTVMITGESGTGKELLSRAVHSASPRSNEPFIAINCAAIPDALLESELFGYEEGAFTGAGKSGKPGKFELAHGGTLFLDEIGDMSLSLQAKLLRAVEGQRIERVGGVVETQVDIRIITATNKDLEKMVREKEFREDLYFRINVIPLHIPPLRERKGDIPLLLEYFLKKFALPNSEPRELTAEALEVLNNYNWPGNIRELSNCIEYALSVQPDKYITENDLPLRIMKKVSRPLHDQKYEELTTDSNSIMTIEEMEKSLIIAALEKFGESHKGKTNAAEALGINPSTLYRKLKRYNI